MTSGGHRLDAHQHDDNVLMRRYRLHEMSSQEAAAFEVRLFREPALCATLKADFLIAAGLRSVVASSGHASNETPCSIAASAAAGT